MPAKEFYPDGGDDGILLQGVVDCWFEEDGEIILVDFKTDRVTSETVESAAEGYRGQLETYEKALIRVTGKKVREKYLYFFSVDKAFLLKS